MFHYGDHTDESTSRQSRNTQQQQKDFDPSVHRHHHSKNRMLVEFLSNKNFNPIF